MNKITNPINNTVILPSLFEGRTLPSFFEINIPPMKIKRSRRIIVKKKKADISPIRNNFTTITAIAALSARGSIIFPTSVT